MIPRAFRPLIPGTPRSIWLSQCLLLFLGGVGGLFGLRAASPCEIIDPQVVAEALAGRSGVFYLLDGDTERVFDSNPQVSGERFAPCSTFKIWNALAGLELGIIHDSQQPFYTWDGVERSIAGWNKNLNLREAFQASCVPAFQDLARKIGRERMEQWVQKLSYGNRDTSAGPDVFWLPEEGRTPILISAQEQARLLKELFNGRWPVAENSVRQLRQIMEVARTPQAVLYGKTGTSSFAQVGWFVGVLESESHRYAFACLVRGDGATGAEARAITEKIFEAQHLL